MRRLQVLIDHLPPESATLTAVRDGMSAEDWQALEPSQAWGPWSREGLLLASIADRLSGVQWAVIATTSEKPPPYPEPMPRPGVGLPPKASGEQEKRDGLRRVAELKARERARGAQPTPEQVQAVLDELGQGVGDG